MRLLRPTLALVTLLGLSTGCGDDTGTAGGGRDVTFDYSSTLMAPTAQDFSDNSDETPRAEEGLATVSLDSGATVAIWIDPVDIAKVKVQHSDPDDPDAWTAPQTIFEAGDGCLIMDAATNGTVVAVGLGCYADDAFIQQAPDQGAALVTTDLSTWETQEGLGEFSSEPEVSADGDVRFRNDVYPDQVLLWTEDGGFSAE